MKLTTPCHQAQHCEALLRNSGTLKITLGRRHSHSESVVAMLEQLLLLEQKQPLRFLVVSSQYLLGSVSLKSITEALNIYNCTSGLKL